MEPNDPKEIKIVFNSLFDTFVKYLNPEVIIEHNSYFGEHKNDIFENQASAKRKAECLLEWISADDNAAVHQFTDTLRDLACNSENMNSLARNGKHDVEQQMKYLAKLLDGSLLNELSKSDVDSVLDIMLDKEIIIKKFYQQAKDIETPKKCCIKMFKGIKSKPNWPFVFFDAVSNIRPDLIPPETLKVDKPNESCPENVRQVASRNVESDDDLLHCLEELSELTDSFVNESLEPKVILSPKEIKSIPIQAWMQSGNIDASSVVSWEGYEGQELLNPWINQCDADDIDDRTIHGETPELCLRDYQKELAEPALNGQNTIICAPTGSGKTIVAVHIILNHLQEPHNDKRTRKIVFFARTVSLVNQQYNVIKKFLPKQFTIISVTGDRTYSLHLDSIIPMYDVLVMTPHILENYFIRNQKGHMDKFSLVIFDECHHARKEESYNKLMLYYLKRKQMIKHAYSQQRDTGVKLPQIVGLTASIGVENASTDNQAKENILQVCGNLDVPKISCVEDNIEELRETVHSSGEELLTLSERETDDAVCKILGKITELELYMLDLAKKLNFKDLTVLLGQVPLNRKSMQYCQWTVNVKKLATTLPRTENNETNGYKRSLIILSDYLSTYNVALQLHDLVLLKHVIEYLKKCFDQYRENQNCTQDEKYYFQSFSELEEELSEKLNAENPNLILVKKCLLKYLIAKGESACGIIFVKTRALVAALTSWLNTCGDKRIEDLKATALTGTVATAAQRGMTDEQKNDVIQLFRIGDVRLLVATSVAQEGTDIPQCNLVIRYNYDGNEITSIQTKGRIRKKGGMSIILAMPKIIQKEPLNKEMAERMDRAIKLIRQMDPSEIHKKLEVHQEKILKDEKQREEKRKTMKNIMRRQHFKMVCHGCGDLVIDSDNIRTVCQTHHVVIDSNILIKTRTYLERKKNVKCIDDILLVGPVKCLGKLKAGGVCNSNIGSLMIFSNMPFVVLGLKKRKFGFETVDYQPLGNFTKWKEVPFIIDEIGPKDVQRYMPELGDVGNMSLQMKYDAVQLLAKQCTNVDGALEQQMQASRDACQFQALQSKTIPANEKVSSELNKSTKRKRTNQISGKTFEDEYVHPGFSKETDPLISTKRKKTNQVSGKTSEDEDIHPGSTRETGPLTSTKAFSDLDQQELALLNSAPSLKITFSSMHSSEFRSAEPQSFQMSDISSFSVDDVSQSCTETSMESDKTILGSENLKQSCTETPMECDTSLGCEILKQSGTETSMESNKTSLCSEDLKQLNTETSMESDKTSFYSEDLKQSYNNADESTEAAVKDLVEIDDSHLSTYVFTDA